jgi:uncharacterized protein YyaL (SSP411 family)
LAVRQKRAQPARDEKIVIADNALTIIGFSQAGKALNEPSLTKTAERTANWIWKNVFDSKSGELKHLIYQDRVGGAGFLDDYALLGQAFLSLYHSTGKKRWRSRARQLTNAMLQRFARPDGQLASSWDSIDLVIAPTGQGDSTKPSGQSSAIALLLDLTVSTGEKQYANAAYRAILPLYSKINANPAGWGSLLAGISEPKALRALQLAANSTATPYRAASLDSSAYAHARAQRTDAAELILTVKIDQGYHINANPASEPFLVATQVLVDGQADIEVEYPASRVFKAKFAPEGIAVYQDRIILKAKLPTSDPESHPQISLRVQACNDEICLAPVTIAAPVGGPKP